jgi:hypothetical protein
VVCDEPTTIKLSITNEVGAFEDIAMDPGHMVEEAMLYMEEVGP